MNDPYKKILISLEAPRPSVRLVGRIESRIVRARVMRNRARISFHGIVATGSIVMFITALQYTSAEASQSGFYDYASLLISDGKYLISSWKEVSVTMLESAPVMGAALSLGALIVLTNAIRRGARYISPTYVSSLIRA
ncbi:MAG: hypothetical protein KBC33_00230 [Candidatus Pacebacteria bacterium]|nr:hypothetical protein [Candidatus Paceibacterota bacterium]